MPAPAVLDQQASDAAYDRWAPIYDLVFNLPFQPGRRAAAQAAAAAAGRNGDILVVGVGTGLELPLLPATARVTGVDLSRAMLEVARKRVARQGLAQVKALLEMDAQALSFEAAVFNVALAPYVMSVVPDPTKALDEMWRVVRPGGELVLINHFASTRGWQAAVDQPRYGPNTPAVLEALRRLEALPQAERARIAGSGPRTGVPADHREGIARPSRE